MEDYKKDSDQKKSEDCQYQDLSGCTDEELLNEFTAASRIDDAIVPNAPQGEADIIWERIQNEFAEAQAKEKQDKVVRRKFGWKKVAAIGLIACVLTGSGCFVAMGRKSYFFREIEIGIGKDKVLVNDSFKATVNGENDAYVIIEDELGIKPLKMAYIPNGMKFDSLEIGEGYATLIFNYKGKGVYFTQTKYDDTAIYNHKAKVKEHDTIFNKWLNQKIKIEREDRQKEGTRYETTILIDGAYYGLSATIEESEFIEIVERLAF